MIGMSQLVFIFEKMQDHSILQQSVPASRFFCKRRRMTLSPVFAALIEKNRIEIFLSCRLCSTI